MPHTDRLGLPLTTRSDAAAAAYRDGIDLMLSAWPGADDALDRAMAADPRFAMAHAARARVHFNSAQPAEAKARIAIAQSLSGEDLTPRERSHIDTLALGMSGQATKCLTATLAHLDTWPSDAVILSLPMGAFGLYAFSGMAEHNQARVDLSERHAAAYGDDWWFGTYRGWSHTENGNAMLGRDLTQRALDKRPANANAAHALAHAMFELGAMAEADAFIARWLPTYDHRGTLYGHIFWHQALAALHEGDAARALQIYSEHLQPMVSEAIPLVATTDCASLLWRMRLYGHDVPQRLWTDLAVYAESKFPQPGVSFADVHMAFLAVATGNTSGFATRLADLDARLANGKLPAGAVVPALYRATQAFADGDPATCVRILKPLAGDIVRIGGSHAQREVIEEMLLVALLADGAADDALPLLDRRIHHASSQRDIRWRADAARAAQQTADRTRHV